PGRLARPNDRSSGGSGGSNPEGPRSASTVAAMKTVLVVDDEPRIAPLARDYLEHAGFAVLLAGDGKSGLQAVRTRQPDLVVLDLGLPELDGLEVTRAIREPSTLPIVMLTARDDELDRILGLEL